MIVMGLENEYAVAAPREAMSPADISATLLRAARRRITHVPDRSAGIFTGSGARFYVDCGSHPEWCTPECLDPAEVVAHVRAGERRLALLLAEIPGAILLRANVDYAAQTTWGSHESYLHRIPLERLAPILLPHLASRAAYTGAGGLDPFDRGIRFVLSPRALFTAEIGARVRPLPILDGRTESLAAAPFRRLHCLLGEALCGDRALWLRVGTTALLVALADAGLIDCPDVPMLGVTPPQAAVRFARDPSLRAAVPLSSGGSATAIDVQRRYRDLAADRCPEEFLPWARAVIDEWTAALAILEARDGRAAARFEWGAKRAIFESMIVEAGFDPADLARFSVPPSAEAPPASRDVRRLLELRRDLALADARFGQIPDGAYIAIAPLLDHAIPAVSPADVRRAMTHPPRGARAEARGEAIRGLPPARRERCMADWTVIFDERDGRALAMHDPLERAPAWAAWSPASTSMPNDPSAVYNRGDFGRLRLMLEPRAPSSNERPYRAWLLARTGRVDEAALILAGSGAPDDSPSLIVDFVSIFRFRGLTPRRELWAWIERAEAADRSSWAPNERVSYLGNHGWALGRVGRLRRAIDVLEEALRIPLTAPNQVRIAARCRVDLADCLRRIGRREEAAAHLAEAGRFLAAHEFMGDLVDQRIGLAKLLGTATDSCELLRGAIRSARRLRSPIAEARGLLLLARIGSGRTAARECRRRVRSLRAIAPDLDTCPLLARVEGRWHEWVGEPDSTFRGDRFWTL